METEKQQNELLTFFSNMIDVSIIILNYNGKKILKKTVQSVLNLAYPKDKYEIIIVDNASQDNSKNIIKNICTNSNPQLSITSLFLHKNIGFASGNNVGIKKAKGEYVVLLNNDCEVDPNWLTEMIKTAENDKGIFAVNPKVYLQHTNKIQSAGIRIRSDGYASDIGSISKNKRVEYEEDRGQYNAESEIDAACGVASLYRKSILKKIGLLDEEFFLYYEDVELSLRARKAGYQIIYSPKAIVHHLHAASSAEWSPFFIYHTELGRLLLLKKQFPFFIFLKEYMLFSLKGIFRFIFGFIFKPHAIKKNIQYIKVSLYFFGYRPV